MFIAVAAALAVLSSSAGAAADTVEFAPGEPLNVRLGSPSTVVTDGGTEVRLPEGVYLLGPAEWEKLDAELRRLQEAETRLGAENQSLRESARLPSWKLPVSIGVVVGLVAGILITRRLSD